MAKLMLCNEHAVKIEEVGLISKRSLSIALSQDEKFVKRITSGARLVEKFLQDGHIIYGVNTGVGENCGSLVSSELVKVMPEHIVRFHGCALGKHLNAEETRAVMFARLVSLIKGFSGIRFEFLQQLALLLQKDVLPLIPQEGSVGASGDLSLLSYIGSVMSGFRDVTLNGEKMSAADALRKVGMKPLTLENKEGLAILNGTSAMTGLACLAWLRARKVSQLTTRITSLAVVALKGNRYHYDEILFSVKDHAGQKLVAKRIREDLLVTEAPADHSKTGRIQDRYSLRCSPQIIGVLEDVLSFTKQVVEAELNSTNDNPIIDVDSGKIFHGGHFYGGHIAMAMDTLKCQVANMGDLLDRQIASLVDVHFNNGLPADLSGTQGPKRAIMHGLKGLQITCSGWTAEALKLSMPASVFSRSTECHNQDKVSMGTISARDCLRVLDLTEQVVAGLLVAVKQAIGLRMRETNALKLSEEFSSNVQHFMSALDEDIPFINDDIFLEPILRKVLDKIREMEELY